MRGAPYGGCALSKISKRFLEKIVQRYSKDYRMIFIKFLFRFQMKIFRRSLKEIFLRSTKEFLRIFRRRPKNPFVQNNLANPTSGGNLQADLRGNSIFSKKSSHDLTLCSKKKKVKVMTLTFFYTEKSQSHDLTFR